jgi:hypothetical protein
MSRSITTSCVRLPRRGAVGTVARRATIPLDADLLRQALADLIASLPGVSCRGTLPKNAAVVEAFFLDSAFTLHSTMADSVLFGTLDWNGRVSLNVRGRERDEIVRTGWGEIRGDRLRTFPPRDFGDLTALWRIILIAYFELAERRDSSAWYESRRQPECQPRYLGSGETGRGVAAPGALL